MNAAAMNDVTSRSPGLRNTMGGSLQTRSYETCLRRFATRRVTFSYGTVL